MGTKIYENEIKKLKENFLRKSVPDPVTGWVEKKASISNSLFYIDDGYLGYFMKDFYRDISRKVLPFLLRAQDKKPVLVEHFRVSKHTKTDSIKIFSYIFFFESETGYIPEELSSVDLKDTFIITWKCKNNHQVKISNKQCWCGVERADLVNEDKIAW